EGLRLLAETREVRRKLAERGERLVRVKLASTLEQHLFALDVVRIRHTALDRAHCLTGLVIVKPDALGTEVRVDNVDVVAFRDRFVRALWLAGAAVDALLGDHRGHGREFSFGKGPYRIPEVCRQ